MSKKIDSFVLDCSLTMAWCFPDEETPYTLKVQEMLEHAEAKVPSLWPLEVANILWSAENKKRLTKIQSSCFLDLLGLLPIIVDDQTILHATRSTLELARELHITVYDASYLELALREKIPLATLDVKLKKAAQEVKVSLL